MAAFTLRPATLADAEALCALHKASVRALCAGAYTAAEIEAWLRDREPAGFVGGLRKNGFVHRSIGLRNSGNPFIERTGGTGTGGNGHFQGGNSGFCGS